MQLKIEIDKKSIGRRLKTARESFGLTQEKLSEEMGCTSKYISKVENGASAPSLPFVVARHVSKGRVNCDAGSGTGVYIRTISRSIQEKPQNLQRGNDKNH